MVAAKKIDELQVRAPSKPTLHAAQPGHVPLDNSLRAERVRHSSYSSHVPSLHVSNAIGDSRNEAFMLHLPRTKFHKSTSLSSYRTSSFLFLVSLFFLEKNDQECTAFSMENHTFITVDCKIFWTEGADVQFF
jgi:hypothetical protein